MGGNNGSDDDVECKVGSYLTHSSRLSKALGNAIVAMMSRRGIVLLFTLEKRGLRALLAQNHRFNDCSRTWLKIDELFAG